MPFFLGFFLFIVAMQGCNRSASSGTSQGLVFSELTDASRTNYDVCWAAGSDWIPPQVRANLESKVVEQYNNRTPVSFRFGADPCSGAPGLEVRISSQVSTGEPGCPSGAAATAHPFLKRSYRSASGGRLGPGSDVILCRETLKTIGTVGDAHFEKELTAVFLHELGHVVGLAHEQERLDVETADTACWARYKAHILAARANNANLKKMKTISVGAYDSQSIMNYCSAVRDTWKSWKNVVLSDEDVRTLESVFGGANRAVEVANPKPDQSPPRTQRTVMLLTGTMALKPLPTKRLTPAPWAPSLKNRLCKPGNPKFSCTATQRSSGAVSSRTQGARGACKRIDPKASVFPRRRPHGEPCHSTQPRPA